MIAPLIAELLKQTQLLPDEQAVVLDQLHNLTQEQEQAWLKLLQVKPDLFAEMATKTHKLGAALYFRDRSYLEELRKEVLQASVSL